MNAGTIIGGATCALCGLIFVGIGIGFIKSRRPVWFWAGDYNRFKAEDFSDVGAYNRGNGLMWLAYAAFWVVMGVVMALDWRFGLVMMFLSLVPGLPVLLVVYNRIFKKYAVSGVKTANKRVGGI